MRWVVSAAGVCGMLIGAAGVRAAQMPGDGQALAASDNVSQGPGDKLKRGLANTFLGWIELPHQFVGCRTSGDKVSNALGLLKYPLCVAGGLAGFGLREVSGIVEVVTFPLPFPTRDYSWMVPWWLLQMSDYPALT
ncbi:MAG: hypothetical protein HYZ92_01470 [Candidatus Omnitrophica bacterium]|nr:hypothetical protein [Candidatus Omnitrophota bacterium]